MSFHKGGTPSHNACLSKVMRFKLKIEPFKAVSYDQSLRTLNIDLSP